MRNINLRLSRLEAKIESRQTFKGVRLCILPENCEDPEAYREQCEAEAEAAGQMIIHIEFVGPAGNSDEGMTGDYDHR